MGVNAMSTSITAQTFITTGILKLILIKYIANFIDNINLISNQVIREIIIELKKGMKLEESPQQNICSNLMQTTGGDIISYTKYVCSVSLYTCTLSFIDILLNDVVSFICFIIFIFYF